MEKNLVGDFWPNMKNFGLKYEVFLKILYLNRIKEKNCLFILPYDANGSIDDRAEESRKFDRGDVPL